MKKYGKLSKHAKKKTFTDCEIKVLSTEVEARKCVLFGGLSSGIKRNKVGGVEDCLY